MPELPEVETVVRELAPLIISKQIEALDIVWHKTFVTKTSLSYQNQKIKSVGRKGKYILIRLQNTVLIIHLRMTGQLLFIQKNNEQTENKYVRSKIRFSDGSSLLFLDKRKFGRIYHVENPDVFLVKVGIDAVDPTLNEDKFNVMLKKSGMSIKAFLLSQKYISGLGNIYVDESLFRAGIHPASVASKISKKSAKLLFAEIRAVLFFAIDNMGSTISDYRTVNGNIGNNQQYFKVYQQTGRPCVNCGNPIKKIKLAQRGTHFCSNCQKIFK